MASSKAMFMEDADEDGTVKPHTKKTAKSVAAPSRAGSPVKQEPNTGRKKSSSQRTHATATTSPHDSDATEHASSSSRHKNRERRSSRKGKEVPERPRITTAQTTPSMRNHYAEDSAHYSVPHRAIAVSSGRPRANSRPQSYMAPPLSQSAFFQASPLSYGPPPQWGGPPPLGSSPLGTSPMAYPVDYFTGRADYDTGGADRLASRFEARPRSSMGNYGSSYEDRYTDFDAPSPHSRPSTVIRKPSLSKRTTKNNEDRRQMPPPPRPSTVGPRQHFRPPPPPPSQRKSVGFDDVSSDGESDLFRDAPHGVAIDFMKAFPIRNRRQSTTRRQSLGGEYPGEGYAIEPAGPKTRRPNRRSVSYSVEDKMNDANRYQNAVASAIPAPLTPDNLRRVKNSTSSRSTRSSGSRDESSFRQSETTKTTRSGSNDDDMTIKVPSGTVVEYGGAKINCVKGGEMTFGRGGGGSDRGTIYGDELRSHAHRTERSGTRPRASSQSAHARRPRAIMSPNPHDHAADYPDNATYFGIPQYATYHGYPYDDDEYDHVYDT
ncbi:hypothetical protein PFICI_08042 [Pestalotiopsis fici W106-1]|uniref:Uncharacterized protein n=1 Tax=Pestalotiopsis fici (strain W106-1 / CGMCC3.15140) TaxID=1229662 RepID=W3X2Y9_PESFW|nr:uncharacterized protein PFICI_08042 [Pestalotiopsis fici W106-1]ETS80513.1 hypothetical protein PFICI_08042 [Pestalotiopsis fici W106-1]